MCALNGRRLVAPLGLCPHYQLKSPVVVTSQQELRFSPFAKADYEFKLAIACNLQRVWADVLKEPVPSELQNLINTLESVARDDQRHVQRRS